MAFTWIGDLSTDLDIVRFKLGDTNEDQAWLADATINALLTSEGSVNGAAIQCVKHIIRQLSKPDFRADWLQVSHGKAVEAWRATLTELEAESGLVSISGTATHVYRADTQIDEEPTYPDEEDEDS